MSDRKSPGRGRSARRRQFLRLGGAASVGILTGLSGCSGGDSSPPGDDSSSGDGGDGDDGDDGGDGGDGGDSGSTPMSQERGDPDIREKYGLPDLEYELEERLNVFQWADYWPLSEEFNTIQVFEDAYGVSVDVSNYASNEEMLNKLRAGGTGQFDVIFPSDYMIRIMNDQDMLQPLDIAKLPHWENLEDRWRNQAPYDTGSERYSAPYFWGTSGISWNEKMLPESISPPLTSWDAMWNEAFAGQIIMLNDMRETIGAALKRLGYSGNSTNESEIQEAKETLIQQKELLLTYSSINMAENLINENATPLHAWSGSVMSAYWELYEDGSSPIGYRVPEEGGYIWVDTAAITKGAKNPNAAHAFINYTLNAKINANIANYVYYPTPNAAAKETDVIFESMLEQDQIYPPESTMEKLEFGQSLGDGAKLWNEAWTELQNA